MLKQYVISKQLYGIYPFQSRLAPCAQKHEGKGSQEAKQEVC